MSLFVPHVLPVVPVGNWNMSAGNEQEFVSLPRSNFSNPLSKNFVLLFLGDEWVILAWKPSLSKVSGRHKMGFTSVITAHAQPMAPPGSLSQSTPKASDAGLEAALGGL